LKYLVSAQAQTYFADGNNEWPVVKGLKLNNPALQAMGGDNFKSEQLPVNVVGMNQVKVQQMLDRVGFR
jgi:iron(III) transport system substrate-binding protein